MSVRKRMLTDEQWTKIEPLIPKRPKNPKGGRPPVDERLASREFSGSSRLAPDGKTCPGGIRITRFVGVG